jgi:hypothetical protein
VRVDRVDLLLGGEDVLHHLQPGVRVEVAGLFGDDLHATVGTALLDLVGEALAAVLGAAIMAVDHLLEPDTVDRVVQGDVNAA